MLNVWCVCVGDKYSDDYVYRLQAMVERNLKQEYVFRCLSDRLIEGVTCVSAPDWPGWWPKLYLFQISKGQSLYIDLDAVIVGPLDQLVSEQLSMAANWAQSGHGGCQSSVMSWGGDYSHIGELFNPEHLSKPANGNYGYYGPRKLWGDQEFITDLLGDPGGPAIKAMPNIYSYKYHCLGKKGPPDEASVICFHGVPKPADVKDQWVKDARSYTR